MPLECYKRLHARSAARAGVEAALLAADGFTGPPTITEGPRGIVKMFGLSEDLGPLLRRPTLGRGKQASTKPSSSNCAIGTPPARSRTRRSYPPSSRPSWSTSLECALWSCASPPTWTTLPVPAGPPT
jgi:hypothetical protein